MPFTRRLITLLTIVGLLALPAVVARAFCLGNSCQTTSTATARVPFCPLPDAIKKEIAAGYYAGRSPDVMTITKYPAFAGTYRAGKTDVVSPWPAEDPPPDTSVPIVFAGEGVSSNASVPDGTQLDAIAPSLANVLRFKRANPTVRSGVAVPGIAGGPAPKLVLEVALKGVGSSELEKDPQAWPYLRSLMRSGAATLSGVTGSLPVNPTSSLTTIGTGGPPSEHGITGLLIRNNTEGPNAGKVAPAWSKEAPPSVISTLADDVDSPASVLSSRYDGAANVGLVAPEPTDRGLIGDGWYIGTDTDEIDYVKPSSEVAVTGKILRTGFGQDDVPDIMGVVLHDSVRRMDEQLKAIVQAAQKASGGSVAVAVAGTGSAAAANASSSENPSSMISTVEQRVKGSEPVVESAVPGGLFLDQAVLGKEDISPQTVVTAMLGLHAPGGGPLLADAFPGFAVSFARYC
jgi:hypothetical protein